MPMEIADIAAYWEAVAVLLSLSALGKRKHQLQLKEVFLYLNLES